MCNSLILRNISFGARGVCVLSKFLILNIQSAILLFTHAENFYDWIERGKKNHVYFHRNSM